METTGSGDVQHATRDAVETPAGTGITRKDFFAEVVVVLRAELDEPHLGFRHSANPMLLKVHFANPRVHYEVWCDAERSILGVGLHFEDGPVSTDAYLAYFDRHIVELKHVLGTTIELERWTASWAHIYEHRPLPRLSNTVAAETARRLGAFIRVLQPLVDASDIAPERPAGSSAERSGPWRKWRR